MAYYRDLAQRVVDSLVEVPGLRVTLEHDGFNHLIPTAVLNFGGDDWSGPSPREVSAALQQGDPPIFLQQLGPPDELMVDPLNLTEPETDVVIRRLREILTA